jgi:hypothetical protein
MCKSSDRSMVIGDLALWEKTGGRSGHWRRPGDLDTPLRQTSTPWQGTPAVRDDDPLATASDLDDIE